MSCSICGGLRGGEGWCGAEDPPMCQRKPECVRAAPGYFTAEEQRAAGVLGLFPREETVVEFAEHIERESRAEKVRAKIRAAKEREHQALTLDEPAEDRGPHWRQTYTGRQIWPLDPRVGDFAIVDIAYGLAGINRYGGGALRNYNVAEHSVLVSLHGDPAYARHKLLHDAAEAVTGVDMGAPLKRHPKLRFWRLLEDAIQGVIWAQFGLDPLDTGDTREIDTRILLDEKAALMAPAPAPWHVPGLPLGCEIRCLSRDVAAEMFLARFRELFPEYRGP